MNRAYAHISVLTLLAAACSQPEAATSKGEAPDAGAKPGIQVETIVLAARTFEDRIEVTGSLEAVRDATLSAQSVGTVKRLLDLGTKVKAGQSVATLDAELLASSVKQAEAQVEAAQASAALAEDNLARQKPLFEGKIISALEFKNISAQHNQAQAQLSQAQAMLVQSRKQLANSRVAAPFSGIVEQHFVEQGEQVSMGDKIARLTDTENMKVKAGMPERYAADIKSGAAVQVAFSAYGMEPRQGRLTFVGRTIDARNRTFQVEAELDNPDGTLKPEMVARLLVTRAKLQDVLTVPLSAVIRDETGDAVFVVQREAGQAVVQRREVEPGSTSGRSVVIAKGLSVGDEVVVEGQSNLTRGDRVEVTRRSADAQARSQ